ncbi:hypothetical protein F5B22DRAFT_186920 [Xylaria bambusicola]|uniref:uncharacterized protein n=1 Tax=Xylaria bambusicola TaxID=326684 RepID=UPI00200777D5|nr:uncharacterized protein F5B22DRAFT_186920 [Xylaria bambusicola]KAI0515376.1 hypothetical protein F5B22DRAFT_186920 [Xylaria bambusicola]
MAKGIAHLTMAKAMKKNCGGRSNFNSNDNNLKNDLYPEDDFSMHGAYDSTDSLPSYRGRGGYPTGNTSNKQKSRQSRNGRKSNNRHLSFVDNPFEKFDLGQSMYGDQQDSTLPRQQADDSRFDGNQANRYSNHHNHHNGRGGSSRGRGGLIRTSPRSNDSHSHSQLQSQKSPRSNKGTQRGFLPPSSPSPSPSRKARPRSAFPSSAARTRFCTECGAVRRANLTLRDWFSSGIGSASDVLDSWSDEVGLGRGSADEMDWQPEPVVRVMSLPTTPPPSTSGASAGGWQQESCNHSNETPKDGGKVEGVPASCTKGLPCGLRPASIGPEFSDIDGGWGSGDSGGSDRGGRGAEIPPSANPSPSKEDQACVNQPTKNGATPWANAAAFGPQNGQMTPPDTPQSLIA